MNCPNPSEWKVTSNPFGGHILYGVYRLRDKNAIDHSGNREMCDRWFDEKELAQELAKAMNEEEKKENDR